MDLEFLGSGLFGFVSILDQGFGFWDLLDQGFGFWDMGFVGTGFGVNMGFIGIMFGFGSEIGWIRNLDTGICGILILE